MDYLIKDHKLELKYEAGKGAWTYHIQIPNTKHLVGKWGSLKVSGAIDDYRLEAHNLFTIKGQDKLISINDSIRKAINKGGGDKVTVTLYLLSSKEQVSNDQIMETFKESNVLNVFSKLATDEKNEIIGNIMNQKSVELQVNMIVKYIEKLSKL